MSLSRTTMRWLAAALLATAGSAQAQVVISQVYGGGGNSSATYTHDFVELFNRGNTAVSIAGWSVQYAATSGTSWQVTPALPNVSLQPGQYFLVQLATGGAVGAALPTIDHNGGNINMAGANGKVALASSTTAFSGSCPTGGSLIDFVGYGTANCSEGGSAAPAGSNQNGVFRNAAGCTDSNVNSADFSSAVAAARNTATTLNPCGGPPLPTVSFVGSFVTAQEGGDGDANPMNFLVDVAPAPLPGSPVSFNIGVSGPMGRFTYGGPASLMVTDQTTLPITITVDTVGNTVVQGDATVTVTLSGFTGTAAGQDDPISKDGTIVEDDLAPLNVSVADVTQDEGNSGTSTMLFLVQLDGAAGPGGVSFDYSVVAGTAKADEDYVVPINLTGFIPEFSEATTIEIPIVGDLLGEFDESFSIVLSNVQGAGVTDGTALGTILNDDRWYVWQLQGSGACSPLIDPCVTNANTAAVTVPARAAIVTAIGPDGFAMETPAQEDDGDQLTSNGIYVFTFTGAPLTDGGQPLAVGDLVEVTGGVKEFFGLTEIQVNSTRNALNSIVRLAPDAGLTLATPVEFSATRGVPSQDPAQLSCPGTGPGGPNNDDTNFECFEGMRVSIPDGFVSAANQRFSTTFTFEEAYINPLGIRGVREAGALFALADNPAPGAGEWDGNPEIIEMDADFLLPANAGLGLVGGARFNAVGIISFGNGDYEFWPSQLNFVAGTNVLVRPVPAASPNELTIGSFNAFRLCDALANTPSRCAATDPLETDTNRVIHERGQVSAYLREVLRSPDVVAMQEVENLSILQALATQIAADGGPTYQAFLTEGNDIGGIDVGYLVNTARVSVVAVEQRLGAETWDDPGNGPGTLLHDRPPLLLTADFVGNGRPFRFQVVNNHTRSRGCVDFVTGGLGCTSVNDSNRVRAKRFVQARAIATLVQDLQTVPPTAAIPLIVIGDHNAYQFSDGYADVVGLIAGTFDNAENTCTPSNAVTDCQLPGNQNIVTPALTNAVLLLDQDDQYSYNFTEDFGPIQGSASRDLANNQVLDHALFNALAQPFVTGMAYGRGNVDAPEEVFRDCNYRFRSLTDCPQGPDANPPGPWLPTGSSDHDGLVIYLAPPLPDEIFADGFEP